MNKSLSPKDRAEQIALFRSEIIGALVRRDLERGDLRAALRELSTQRFRPPGAQATRTFSLPTLERWYYAYRRDGLDALRPKRRSDTGRAQALTNEQRQLLLDIRREYPRASVPTILRTLVADGRLASGAVSEATIRRLYADNGLDRASLAVANRGKVRLRWQAARPGALWHGDVCHGQLLKIDGVGKPLRIHALMDDASRYVVALEAHHSEQEIDMLGLFVRALRRHPAPDALYLDNGSTYIGTALRLACERLGITLIHAKPYDAPARGKMERFWRTLRAGCLAYIGSVASLHDVQVRLLAFLDQHYHLAPHAGLMGRSPATAWSSLDPEAERVTQEQLHRALTVRERRRVRRDNTLSVNGKIWQLDAGYLAGRIVVAAFSLLDPNDTPWVEHDSKRLALQPVDPVANSRRPRPALKERQPITPFDPPSALLDRAVGRTNRESS